MPSLVPLAVTQGNDVTVDLSVTQPGGTTPQPLGSLTPSMTVKAAATAPDSQGTVLTVGSGLTVSDSNGGLLTAFLPRTLLARPVPLWYRVDVEDGLGHVTTAIEGPISVSPA